MRFAAVVCFVGAAAGLSACGNPDSIVYGGFSGNPSAIITNVRSAIHANVPVNVDPKAPPVTLTVIALSDSGDLCTKVSQHPDYFQVAYETSTTLILFVPQNRVGSFGPGNADFTNSEIVVDVVGDGGTGRSFPYPGAEGQGIISLSELDSSNGGEGTGSFDIVIADAQQFGHEFFGNFKSHTCAALSGVKLP